MKIEGSKPITVLSDLSPESEITDLIESGVSTRENLRRTKLREEENELKEYSIEEGWSIYPVVKVALLAR